MSGFIKKSLQGVLVVTTLLQNSWASADMIVDLPNPDQDADESYAVPTLPETVATEYKSHATLEMIPRKSGGTLYKVTFNQTISLSRLSLKISSSKAKIYKVEAISKNGDKKELRSLRSENALNSGTTLSQVIEDSEITGLEILIESYGSESTVELAAVSNQQVPRLSVVKIQEQKVVKSEEKVKSENKGWDVLTSNEVLSQVKAGGGNGDRVANYDIPLREGDFAYNLERENVKVRILERDREGKYTIRFLEGHLKNQIGAGWSRDALMMTWGCSKNLCVGDVVYNKDREGVAVKVIGLSYDGNHYLEFLEGALKGKKGAKWSITDLTTARRCGQSHCIGEKFLLVGKDRDPAEVVILAIDGADKYFVHFLTGELKGKRGGNWDPENLVSMRGCSQGLCVGDVVHNSQRDFVKVKIVGIHKDGKYVIEFLEGSLAGQSGAYWTRDNLKKFNY